MKNKITTDEKVEIKDKNRKKSVDLVQNRRCPRYTDTNILIHKMGKNKIKTKLGILNEKIKANNKNRKMRC